MNVIEYGTEHNEIMIFLHGGGLSWWNFKEIAESLQSKYHIIIPMLDGHANSDCCFINIEDCANRILAYIDTHCNGRVLCIAGLSLGAQILLEILSQRKDICRIAIVESALIKPMPLTHKLVKTTMDMSYGLISKKWFSKLQFHTLKIKESLYEEYYRDTCLISKENYISILEANSNYTVKKTITESLADIHILVGEKENKNMIDSAIELHKLLPNSSFTIKENLYHGEFSINHAKEYVTFMMKSIKQSERKEDII